MAKATKQGLDYFPLDCIDDNRIRLLQAKHGTQGFGVIIKLMQRIYGVHGYYTEWDSDIAELFAYENRVEDRELNEIISFALTKGIFDEKKYKEYGILTSKDIQQRYIEATQRRKNVTLDMRYALIMYTSCQHDDNKSEQSKVKESKVNKIKVNESRVEESKVKESKADQINSNESGEESKVKDEIQCVYPRTTDDLDSDACGAPPPEEYEDIYGIRDNAPLQPITWENEDISRENTPQQPTNRENDNTTREITPPPQGEKNRYGEYENVLLTEEEHDSFVREFPTYAGFVIERLSEYIACKGKSYPAHYPILRKWAREDKEKYRKMAREKEEQPSFDVDEFFELALKRSKERMLGNST